MSRQQRSALTLLALALALPTAASAQAPDTTRKVRVDSSRIRQLDPINVTAARSPREILRTPQPVLVVDSAAARRRAAYTVSDLFRLEPGVDITGTGTNQARLAIRGQRGQRILLLENGIRLNNARRQQDFGELPALSDVESLERAELVRGPASVLYGTDAIGGVVNLITAGAPTSGPSRISGEVGYRYSSHDRQSRPAGYVAGRFGTVGFRFSGTWRDTEPYRAPSGSFGSVTLSQPVRVHDTGVRDENYSGEIGFAVAEGHNLFARYARYSARNAGFGFVNPDDFGAPDDPDLRIFYPRQTFEQASVRYQTSRISSFLANRLELTTYYQSNARNLNFDVFVPFSSPPASPGGGVSAISRNFTDIDTWGFRVEAARIVGGRHTFTYGGDFSRDDSFNRDSSVTTVTGFGPPQQDISNTPPVPNAIYQTGGLFAQAALALSSRLSATLGVRAQDVRAHTLPTEGVTGAEVRSSDQTVVGAANLLYQLTPKVALVGNAGRAFRSPNLVERFFEGPLPEGNGFQQRNPELGPETSFTMDLGLKVRAGPAYFEGFYFRSTIRNGIRVEPTGEMVGPFPAFRNVNVDKIHDEGVELLGDVRLASGLGARASFSTHSAEDALDPNNPVGDTYSRKLAGELRYDDPGGRGAPGLYGARRRRRTQLPPHRAGAPRPRGQCLQFGQPALRRVSQRRLLPAGAGAVGDGYLPAGVLDVYRDGGPETILDPRTPFPETTDAVLPSGALRPGVAGPFCPGCLRRAGSPHRGDRGGVRRHVFGPDLHLGPDAGRLGDRHRGDGAGRQHRVGAQGRGHGLAAGPGDRARPAARRPVGDRTHSLDGVLGVDGPSPRSLSHPSLRFPFLHRAPGAAAGDGLRRSLQAGRAGGGIQPAGRDSAAADGRHDRPANPDRIVRPPDGDALAAHLGAREHQYFPRHHGDRVLPGEGDLHRTDDQ